MRTPAAITGVLLAAVLALAGCSSSPPPIQATFDNSPTKLFTGPSGVGRSLQQQASEASITVLNEFLATMGRLQTSRRGSTAELAKLALDPDPLKTYDNLTGAALYGDPMLTAATAAVNAARKARWSGGGAERISNWTVTNYEAPADSSGVATPGMAFTELRACVDVSGFKPTLPNGKPAYNQNRRAEHLQKYLVMNPKWPDRSGWRIATQYVKYETACTAA